MTMTVSWPRHCKKMLIWKHQYKWYSHEGSCIVYMLIASPLTSQKTCSVGNSWHPSEPRVSTLSDMPLPGSA